MHGDAILMYAWRVSGEICKVERLESALGIRRSIRCTFGFYDAALTPLK